jgi:O-acetyl-ADP-ribose deacetylase (regulator of RNase III)
MDISLQIKQGDITQYEVDALVTAANKQLKGGGGVDGAIHKAGGPAILEECQKIIQKTGTLAAGDAVITGGGNVKANHVIHAVGPVFQDGNHGEPGQLANAYNNALQIANDHGLASIAFPIISTGVYGFPKESAATIAIETVVRFSKTQNKSLEKVIFVCFDEENYTLYQNHFATFEQNNHK